MSESTARMPLSAKGTGRIDTSPASGFARILGVGAYRPERVVTNEEICRHIDSSDEWIRERTGIVSRRFAAADESVIDMAVTSSRGALEMAGVSPEQIDAVILATISHPDQTPAAAPQVATRLGIPNAAAFDLSAACAGYCHGIGLANDLVRGGTACHVLVIGVEKLTDFIDPADRGTSFIFADGAGAAVVGPSDEPGIGPTVWGSDGSQWEAISQRESWVSLRGPLTDPAAPKPTWPTIGMAGQTVFRWAVWGMAPVAQQALERAGVTLEDLDAFIPHQANLRIVDALVKRLRLPADVAVARDIEDTGNTSAASVPLATWRLLDEGLAPRGGLALQMGFGAGLSYAAQVVRLP